MHSYSLLATRNVEGVAKEELKCGKGRVTQRLRLSRCRLLRFRINQTSKGKTLDEAKKITEDI